MADDNELELSLGLSCGGSSGKQKGISSSDFRTEDGDVDKGNKIVNDFRNFLHASTQPEDSGTGSQSDSVKPQENFLIDLSKSTADGDASLNLNSRGLWAGSSYRPIETDDENRLEASNKRKMILDEINQPKKHEKEVYQPGIHGKAKASHVSITTDDGSAAEHEDVAESEVEGSTSRLAHHHDDSSKRSTPEFPKEVHGFTDPRSLDPQSQRRFGSSSESEFKLGHLAFGVPFSVQSVNMINGSPSLPLKDANAMMPASTLGNPPPGVIQLMPSMNNERTGIHSLTPGNMPLMFGYSPVQLPTLDKDNSWGLPHSQQLHHSFAGKSQSTYDKLNGGLIIPSAPLQGPELTPYDGRIAELVKSDGKQRVPEEGSSSQTEDDAKGSSKNLRAKDAPERLTSEGLSFDFSVIKPGIAADIKFGGCGSYPNLPWVSTTGQGPNGRTISGVTYRYSANQIRIVCACHGSHMSPEEFVQHAGEEQTNPEGGTGLSTFTGGNPAASAQS